jgi:hypothetical protein
LLCDKSDVLSAPENPSLMGIIEYLMLGASFVIKFKDIAGDLITGLEVMPPETPKCQSE